MKYVYQNKTASNIRIIYYSLPCYWWKHFQQDIRTYHIMPHPKPSSPEAEHPMKRKSDDNAEVHSSSSRTARSSKKIASSNRAKKKAIKDVSDDEADLIKSAETAVLDCLACRLEEKREAGKGGYPRGYSKQLVEILAPRHPWLTSRMLTAHLNKRKRQKRKKDEEDTKAADEERPRKRGRSSKKSADIKATETTPRKRGRPQMKSEDGKKAAEMTQRKRGRPPKSDKAESSSSKKASPEKVEGKTKGEGEDVAKGLLKDPPKEDESRSPKEHGESEAEECDKPRRRNAGGRPKGTGTKQRPRGSKILTAEEKYDKDRYKQARDYAALEYHKIRHTTESKRLKKGVLNSILQDAKKRFSLPEDYQIAHSTILGRVKRGVLIATGTKSPMERVEEELVRICNDRLKTMNRQLFAHEGTELANSLVKKYGMEEEIRKWKMRHSFVATEADGTTPIEEKACYMGKAYWNQFLKRNGHRLEVRKVGRVGPQTPMVKVEDQLVEMVNALQRPVRPSEGVRLALSLVEGTPLETELRDFKVRTLKNKSAENKKGELLGPGYWRAFIRRNKNSLPHLDGKMDEGAVVGANRGIPTESMDASNVIHNATTSTAAAESEAAVHIETPQNLEAEDPNVYNVAQAAPSPAVLAVEAYNLYAAPAASSITDDSASYVHNVQVHQWHNQMRSHMI
uniref:Uncharacterized protein n=1 Tax=Odontella aurita TaxID=265563 RepID=A0A7S4J066_9STRA